MRELKLKYTIVLVSNISQRAAEEAKALERAQQMMRGAVEGTSGSMRALGREITRSRGNIGELQGAITGATSRFVLMDRALNQMGGNVGTRRQITYLNTLRDRAEQAAASVGRLRDRMGEVGKKKIDIADVATTAYTVTKVVTPFLKNFATLESAESDLKISMMTKGGKVDGNYEAIKKIAVEQGNKLPGTIRDMTEAATELISLGITPESVRNGGLVASTNLGVVLGMDQKQTAMTVAKLSHAYNLKDDELPQMADQVQRNRGAGGIKPEELLMAAKYEGPMLNMLGMGGLKGMSEVLTLQGIANRNGMNGSEFGTNFSEMLTRLATGPLMMAEAKRGIKADARDRLEKLGIKFDFFDKNGQLKRKNGSTVEAMMTELQKFNQIKNKDGTSDDKTKLIVAKALFGSEGARPALILAQAGLAGYEAARARVENQASLDERIAEKMNEFAVKLEALSSTIENVTAHMGKQLGDASKPVMDKANDTMGGKVDEFFQANPTAGTVGIAGGAVGATLLALKAKGLLLGGRGAGAAVGGGVSLAGVGAGAAALFAAYELWQLGSAFTELYDAKNRKGVKLSPYAQARLTAPPEAPGDWRSKGFVDPRIPGIDGPPDLLTPIGGGARNERLEVGDGKLDINIMLTQQPLGDWTATARQSVTQQPSLLKINAGATYPGGKN